MPRIVKAPDIRRAELLDIAETLFQRDGYASTAVEDIVRAAGVAKGTFYHYFRSKEEVLAGLAARLVATMAERLGEVAHDGRLEPRVRLQRMFRLAQRTAGRNKSLVSELQRPSNRELHDLSNVEIVRVIGPLVAGVVEEGKATGLFDVDDAVSTVQFIMAGSLFLFGEGVFDWTPREHAARVRAMKVLIQRALRMNPAAAPK